MKLPNFDGNFRSSICCEVPVAGTAELLALAAYPAYLVSWLTLQVPLLLHSTTWHMKNVKMTCSFIEWKPSLRVPDMDVSKNSGTPKSSILMGFSIINHPLWVPLFLETPRYVLRIRDFH